MSGAPALVAEHELDPRWARVPTIRQAWVIVIPNPTRHDGMIEIRETTIGGRLVLREVGSTIEHEIDLNAIELRALADHATRIARRVTRRPGHRP